MLNKKTKYAFHALTYLGKKNRNQKIQVKEIAEKTKISKKFLESILLDLKNAGILSSKSGIGGGYFLIKKPEQIFVSFIYRMFNGPIALLNCASLNYYLKCADCTDEKSCGLRKIMIKIRDETLNIMQNKTLEDIIRLEVDI